jgi:hypothetical protein
MHLDTRSLILQEYQILGDALLLLKFKSRLVVSSFSIFTFCITGYLFLVFMCNASLHTTHPLTPTLRWRLNGARNARMAPQGHFHVAQASNGMLITLNPRTTLAVRGAG